MFNLRHYFWTESESSHVTRQNTFLQYHTFGQKVPGHTIIEQTKC